LLGLLWVISGHQQAIEGTLMVKRTKKTAKTKKVAKKPAKTKLRIAGLDLRSPAEMYLNYYFARKKSLSAVSF
jgi:hypothetical protein